MKSKVPAKIRASQQWKHVPPVSTLKAEHRRHILNLLRLHAQPDKPHNPALEKALAAVELKPAEKLAHEARKRQQEPYRKEALKYAQVGLDVAASGYWEQAAYCAAMMMNQLWLAKSPFIEGGIQRAVKSAEQADRAGNRVQQRRKQRERDIDAAARAWNKRMPANDIKEPTLKEVAGDTGISVRRLKDLGGKRAIKSSAAALRFDDSLRK